MDDGVLGVEFTVGVLVRLLNALYILHDVQGGDEVDIQLGGVAHQPQDGVGLADAGVDDDAFFLQPGNEAFQLVSVGITFQNDDHSRFLLKICTKKPAAGWLRAIMYW